MIKGRIDNDERKKIKIKIEGKKVEGRKLKSEIKSSIEKNI